jgi:6-phosphogluconolactonase/glucosamine-6-phosphate isomerase/deaminase
MFDSISRILKERHVLSHKNEGIEICRVAGATDGLKLAKELLYAIISTRSALFLSGGRTPKELYASLANEEKIEPGVVGLVDERYGEKFHENSNEKMLKDTGLLRYFQMRDITFHPVLVHGKSREETADEYDQQLRSILAIYPLSVAVLGVGLDGHTAGIAGNRKDFKNPVFDPSQSHMMVSEFDDPTGMYKERVTMTFHGLTMMDLLLVLVFGEDKKEALHELFSNGSEEEVPSRFFKRSDIASKTILITDQQV